MLNSRVGEMTERNMSYKASLELTNNAGTPVLPPVVLQQKFNRRDQKSQSLPTSSFGCTQYVFALNKLNNLK